MQAVKHVHTQMKLVHRHEATLDDMNGLHWQIVIRADECPEKLKKALKVGRTSMVWRLLFPSDFPLSPPFVHCVSPTFSPQTAHVVQGGALCAEILSVSDSPMSWRPTIRIAALIETLLHVMDAGEPRLLDAAGRTTEEEARAGFKRGAARYGWEK